MICQEKEANAIGGKTARACDSCLIKRARWFCATDDGFLCQSCDFSVHSANQLASRHQRVWLQTSSSSSRNYNSLDGENSSPSWYQGVTRNPRTPRQGSKQVTAPGVTLKEEDESRVEDPFRLVPEIGTEEVSENEEQLVFRVPVFDCFDDSEHVTKFQNIEGNAVGEQLNALLNDEEACDLRIPEFLGCDDDDDKELVDFAADVESLLGRGIDEDFEIEGAEVKVEDEDEEEEQQKEKVLLEKSTITGDLSEVKEERRMLLRLNYEAVITAWDGKGSPWSGGHRPDCNPNSWWPDFLGMCTKETQGPHGSQERVRASNDRAREARVSRYREKRRTRLFSKRIRYQVRKLNAEKRPRMKGRFVKRTSISGHEG